MEDERSIDEVVAEYEARIARVERDRAIERLCYAAKAKNVTAVRALVGDAEDAEGTIRALRDDENTAFLFEKPQPLRGSSPASGEPLDGNGYAERLASLRTARDTVGAIALKQAAAREGVFLN